jgi:hypothetical protein
LSNSQNQPACGHAEFAIHSKKLNGGHSDDQARPDLFTALLFVPFRLFSLVDYRLRWSRLGTGFSRIFFHSGAMTIRSSRDNADRFLELAEILALGLMRLLARKSSELSAQGGESSLDFTGKQSGHPIPLDRRPADE